HGSMFSPCWENISTTAISVHRIGSAISSRGRSIIPSIINSMFTDSTTATSRGGIACSAHLKTPTSSPRSAGFRTPTRGTWAGCSFSGTAIKAMPRLIHSVRDQPTRKPLGLTLTMTNPRSAVSHEAPGLTRNWRVGVVLATILVAMVAIFLLPPIPQSELYHIFADKRTAFGIPNCLNVLSNLLFLLVGALGVSYVLHPLAGPAPINGRAEATTFSGAMFIDPNERWGYLAFFVSVALTAFGSAYYHLDPHDGTLLWDRIPMAIGFMALVAATVGERISMKADRQILVPLMALGAGSVVYWQVTQKSGHGDLRPYVLVQFGSVLLILLLL